MEQILNITEGAQSILIWFYPLTVWFMIKELVWEGWRDNSRFFEKKQKQKKEIFEYIFIIFFILTIFILNNLVYIYFQTGARFDLNSLNRFFIYSCLMSFLLYWISFIFIGISFIFRVLRTKATEYIDTNKEFKKYYFFGLEWKTYNFRLNLNNKINIFKKINLLFLTVSFMLFVYFLILIYTNNLNKKYSILFFIFTFISWSALIPFFFISKLIKLNFKKSNYLMSKLIIEEDFFVDNEKAKNQIKNKNIIMTKLNKKTIKSFQTLIETKSNYAGINKIKKLLIKIENLNN